MMTMNLVEDLPASGKTPTQLAREIEKILARYIQDPVVTVICGRRCRPLQPADSGPRRGCQTAGAELSRANVLVDVMIAVGGITDFAAGNRASILRVVDGKPQQSRRRLEDLLKDGDISANVDMLPGDVLIIPESWF
jgi:polysaccharide biosynthesis/export protein